MPLVLIDPPQTEPLTAAEARARLNIAATVTDAAIDSWIKAARLKIEKEYGLSMIEQTWSLILDRFPGCFRPVDMDDWGNWYHHRNVSTDIDILMQPLLSNAIQSLKYLDTDSVEQLLAPETYRLVIAELDARLVLAPTMSWPTTTALASGVVNITFKAGFANAAAVPELLKAAICLHVGYMRALMGRDLFVSSDNVPGVRDVSYTVGGGAQAATEGAVSNLLCSYRRPPH